MYIGGDLKKVVSGVRARVFCAWCAIGFWDYTLRAAMTTAMTQSLFELRPAEYLNFDSPPLTQSPGLRHSADPLTTPPFPNCDHDGILSR